VRLLNSSKNLTVTTQVNRADTYLSRLVGLLGTKSLSEEKALWLDPCDNIHMWFMRYAIDVVFVGGDLKVCAVYENVKPWRAIWFVSGARSAFEMAVGTVKRGRIEIGDQLHVGD
jgi:uncharacterized membrane protein (UPF0127 family)